MPNLPGFCDNCGAIFDSGFGVPDGATATGMSFIGIEVECPVCGSDARALEGVFDFVGNTVKVLAGPQRTIDDLRRLEAALTTARDAGADTEGFKEAVKKKAPGFASLADRLPKNRAELYAFVTLILQIIQLLLGSPEVRVNVSQDDAEVRKVVEQVIKERMAHPSAQVSEKRSGKWGRNGQKMPSDKTQSNGPITKRTREQEFSDVGRQGIEP